MHAYVCVQTCTHTHAHTHYKKGKSSLDKSKLNCWWLRERHDWYPISMNRSSRRYRKKNEPNLAAQTWTPSSWASWLRRVVSSRPVCACGQSLSQNQKLPQDLVLSFSSMAFAWYAQGSEFSPKYCKNTSRKTGIVSSVFVLTWKNRKWKNM